MSKQQSAHMLPGWFMGLFRHVALPGLVIAQMLNLFTALFQVRVTGSTWQTWGITDWTGLAFAVGASVGMGLITLGLSQAMADAFINRKFGTGLIMLVGLLGMMSIEIIAALSATSSHGLTPFDQQIITTFALPIRLPILSIAAALALPLVVLFVGYANRPAVVESSEERGARFAREEAEAQHRAQMGIIGAKGKASLLRAGALALAGKPDISPSEVATLPGKSQGEMGEAAPASSPLGKKGNPLLFTARNLVDWVAETHKASLSESVALDIIKSAKNARQAVAGDGLPGSPWVANNSAAKAAYRRYMSKRSGLRVVGPNSQPNSREEKLG